ncbi:unnamed protein product [Schistocephalus solidus]|uniref:FCH domain-containing protein n=1 Tax=Schistocephalus solidus TaxID=70667 RepID=A0A183TCG7_SCHSO|nr:unnamed protein product [Schistocephalus solidus]
MCEVAFAHAFWGDKNIGFETLIQNLKSGLKNANDFYEFLRELNSLEDSYGKLWAKLSKQISNYATVGSFKPCWNIILETLDQMMLVKGAMCSDRLNLMKDVQKYSEELQKKHRQLRENEAGTQEVVHAFQAATTQLQKAKDLYHTRYTEYERIRLNESHSAKEKEKAEGKLKKAQDDYKYSVEKYNNLRTQFVEKMRVSCAHFQVSTISRFLKICLCLSRKTTYVENLDMMATSISLHVYKLFRIPTYCCVMPPFSYFRHYHVWSLIRPAHKVVFSYTQIQDIIHMSHAGRCPPLRRSLSVSGRQHGAPGWLTFRGNHVCKMQDACLQYACANLHASSALHHVPVCCYCLFAFDALAVSSAMRSRVPVA